ncbi:MAG: class II aldolase/adducin family protein [Firmicutes bacterium]|nr:class II aldolase/adducin family protein [Bacillota bacterium]
MASEIQSCQDIVEVGRRIWLRGYVAANDGNISIRLGPDEFLCTPTGVSKGFMTPEMMIKVNSKGEKIAGASKPSSEIKMHLAVYRDRPDVNAVVHAHPPVSTAFAVAGLPLSKPVMTEVIMTLGSIPLTEYATPSTDEVPQSIAKFIKHHDAILLKSHGALTVGFDVFDAYYKMEILEHSAAVSLAARQLGGEKELEPDQVKRLVELTNKAGIPGLHPGYPGYGGNKTLPESAPDPGAISEERLAKIITETVQKVLKEQKIF